MADWVCCGVGLSDGTVVTCVKITVVSTGVDICVGENVGAGVVFAGSMPALFWPLFIIGSPIKKTVAIIAIATTIPMTIFILWD